MEAVSLSDRWHNEHDEDFGIFELYDEKDRVVERHPVPVNRSIRQEHGNLLMGIHVDEDFEFKIREKVQFTHFVVKTPWGEVRQDCYKNGLPGDTLTIKFEKRPDGREPS